MNRKLAKVTVSLWCAVTTVLALDARANEDLFRMATLLPEKALFLVHIKNVRDVARRAGLVDNETVAGFISELNELIERSEQLDSIKGEEGAVVKSWSNNFGEALLNLIGDGDVGIAGYAIDGHVEYVMLCTPTRGSNKDELLPSLLAIRKSIARLCSAVKVSIEFSESQQWSEASKYEAAPAVFELGFLSTDTPYPKRVYCSVVNDQLVLSSSEKLLRLVCETRASKTLRDNRTFASTMNKLAEHRNSPDLSVFIDPRMLQKFLPLEKWLTYDRLLPEFYEPVICQGLTNTLAGAGFQLQVLEDAVDAGKDQELRVIVKGVVRTTLPRTGLLEILKMPGPTEFPRFSLEGWRLEQVEVLSLRFDDVYNELLNDVESSNTELTPDESDEELMRKFKNSYSFRDFYQRLDGKYWMGRVLNTENGTTQVIKCMKFKNSTGAEWYAEQASMSGAVNQAYPFEKKTISGLTVYVRSDSVVRKLTTRLGKRSNRTAYVVGDRWCIITHPSLINDLTASLGLKPELSERISSILQRSKKLSLKSERPFYVSYRSSLRQSFALGRLLRLLEYDKKYGGRPGYSHPDAPTTLAERIVLTSQFRFIQTFVESFGETITLIGGDYNSIQFTVTCFEVPDLGVEFDVPSLLDYLDVKPKDRRSSR